MTETQERDRLESAREQAQAQYDSIVELVENMRASEDDDAYAEICERLATEAGFGVTCTESESDGEFVYRWGKLNEDPEFDEYETEEEAWQACCDDAGLRPDADEARQRCEENALSLEVREGWHAPHEKAEPEEFQILLCTGGPAVRIMGELDRGEPTRAWLQCQDWFTPWTDCLLGVIDSDILLDFCRVFYFGD